MFFSPAFIMENYLIIQIVFCTIVIIIGILMVIFPKKMEELMTTRNKAEENSLRLLGIFTAVYGIILLVVLLFFT